MKSGGRDVIKRRKEEQEAGTTEKTEPGRFAEGPRQPRLILPASAVSEQETQENSSVRCKNLKNISTPCKETKTNLQGLARNSEKLFDGLQETRREKPFQNRAMYSPFFSAPQDFAGC